LKEKSLDEGVERVFVRLGNIIKIGGAGLRGWQDESGDDELTVA